MLISKMNGTGNDFILIDHRAHFLDASFFPDLARLLCRRQESVGADGLILVEDSLHADFKWRFFNADGSEAEMCGNGGRCVARYAFLKGIAGPKLCFETMAGVIHAEVSGKRVFLELPLPKDLRLDREVLVDGVAYTLGTVNTGVPHAVLMLDNIEQVPVVELGRNIRFHREFQPAGTNVNFVQVVDKGHLAVRTYERGVENETLACGTGSVAASLVASAAGRVISPVAVRTRGGEVLGVSFRIDSVGSFTQVSLEGDTCLVFEGTVGDDVQQQFQQLLSGRSHA
jgi:diaminopimelate epimerase